MRFVNLITLVLLLASCDYKEIYKGSLFVVQPIELTTIRNKKIHFDNGIKLESEIQIIDDKNILFIIKRNRMRHRFPFFIPSTFDGNVLISNSIINGQNYDLKLWADVKDYEGDMISEKDTPCYFYDTKISCNGSVCIPIHKAIPGIMKSNYYTLDTYYNAYGQLWKNGTLMATFRMNEIHRRQKIYEEKGVCRAVQKQ